jgi:outer membrane immunogenic protein
MKKLFLGSVALVALGLGAPAALAADQRVAAYAPPPAAYTWTGCYVGAYAGTSTGQSRHTAAPGAVDAGVPSANQGLDITPNFGLSGFIGGGTGGCQWQTGIWVIGFEGDGGASNKSGQAFGQSPFNVANVHETQERWTATMRARLGFTWTDKTLLYVTGGGAWAGVEASEWNTVPVNGPINRAMQHKQTMAGYSVGGGIEYALGYGWSVKSEYLYLGFTDKTYFNPPDNCSGCFFFTTPQTVRLYDHTFKAGMNYKFW